MSTCRLVPASSPVSLWSCNEALTRKEYCYKTKEQHMWSRTIRYVLSKYRMIDRYTRKQFGGKVASNFRLYSNNLNAFERKNDFQKFCKNFVNRYYQCPKLCILFYTIKKFHM